jgi:Secretory lipase
MCHVIRPRRRVGFTLSAVLVALVWAPLVVPGARAATPPQEDPFYKYTGTTPLANIAPGTVLKTRTEQYHVAGIPTVVTAVQLLYRSTGQLEQPTVNVTSVLRPVGFYFGPPRVVSYQSFYDSLNPEDEPSYAITGGLSLGGLIPNVESALIAPALLAGDTVVVPDTEGENADFAAGPEYGYNTLDSLRAALKSGSTGLRSAEQIGLIGYSGGAIATEWAAELAPSYAPEVNKKIIGAAFGGTLVDPAHNLHYVEGSTTWAGVIPMALIGVARAFNTEVKPYLSEYGLELYNKLQKASIVNVLDAYPGLTWAQLAKPEYPTPESIEAYVNDANQLIMGSHHHTPTAPLFIGQGNGGEAEGTPGNKPGIGPGDGVMIAGDVRALAREYCSRGVTVQYNEYEGLSHVAAAIEWLPEAAAWLTSRFIGFGAPQDCSSIAPGNSLEPIPVP